MLVEDIMSTDLVTCDVDASLREAVEEMLRNQVGSTLVVDEVPTGIVTETDVLHAAYVTDAPLSELPVEKTMSSPLVTIDSKKTLRRATQQMQTEGVKKLIVVEEMDVVGIVTAQDVIHHYHDLKAEIRNVVRPGPRRLP